MSNATMPRPVLIKLKHQSYLDIVYLQSMQLDYKYGVERVFEVTEITVANQIIINSMTTCGALILSVKKAASRCKG
jgi:hypothetical protein